MCWTPERRHGRSSFAETTVQHLAMEGHEAMKTHTSYHHTDREKHGGKNMGRNVTCIRVAQSQEGSCRTFVKKQSLDNLDRYWYHNTLYPTKDNQPLSCIAHKVQISYPKMCLKSLVPGLNLVHVAMCDAMSSAVERKRTRKPTCWCCSFARFLEGKMVIRWSYEQHSPVVQWSVGRQPW